MFSEAGLRHFDQLWNLFDRKWFDLGGSKYLVQPLSRYLTQRYARSLRANRVGHYLHSQLERWGAVEQRAHEREGIVMNELPSGEKIEVGLTVAADVEDTRAFILGAFYNLCCLAAHKVTIEQLIFEATRKRKPKTIEDNRAIQQAFLKLVGISNAFVAAEWAQPIILTAVANWDQDFFNRLGRRLRENVPVKRFNTARTWLGTILLWYLGGKLLRRRELMLRLRNKGVLAHDVSELTFNRTLHKLGLITYLHKPE